MDKGKRSEPAELVAVLVFGLLLRLFAGRASLVESGVLLPGYDEYYHMRRILYSVANFPHTLWFDSYLNYPQGLEITWPPLFDQLTAAFCFLLGQRSPGGVEMAASLFPILIGVAAIAVVYFLVRELFDHKTALLAAFMTALAPYYLLYTMFAALDHHCLEVLFSLVILLFTVLAINRPEKRYLFALLAGLSMAALAYTWQGADVYLGIFVIYAAISITLDLKNAKSPRPLGEVMLAAFALALILVLPFGRTPWLNASLLGISAMTAAVAIMLAASHILRKRKASWKAFPAILFAFVLLFAALARLEGGLFGLASVVQSGLEYIWGGGLIGKIGEAEPLIYDAETFSQVAFSWLGFNLIVTLAGLAALAAYIRRSCGPKRQGMILLLTWTAATLLLTFGQARFLYISTVSMGVLISILFFSMLERLGRRSAAGQPDGDLAEGEQAAMRAKGRASTPMILLLSLILLLPTAWDAASFARSTPPAVAGDWQESLAWLKENSNATSFYDLPQQTPEYGVMNWWDYGNWIVYLANRPVVSNNFQAGVQDAAAFYLSESEDEACSLLDAKRCRYVLVDYDLIFAKLAAVTIWLNEDIGSYMRMEDFGSQYDIIPRERLFNTTLGRLYLADGAGLGRLRLIYESKTAPAADPDKKEVKIFEYVPGARLRVSTPPGQNVIALLNMTSNQGRPFRYLNQAQEKDGIFEMTVPYSTEERYGCRATGPYLIFSGSNEADVRMKAINVSEEDVLKGRTIELAF